MNDAEQTRGFELPHIRFFGFDHDAGELPGLAEVGGKAVNLCKLSRAKLPVPPGFVVTTRAYSGFIAENGLGARIAALAAKIGEGDAAMIEAASAQIRGLLAGQPMHQSLAAEILQAYRRLRDAGGERVAVRSSATAEDLPEASFAGQQDTYLNVGGEEPLLKAVQACWASLWTARAVAYRARQKTPAEGLAMAVVVQQMVMADAAGVLFTANPVTGACDEIIINAAWGLGEAVVAGEVTPDHVVVEKASGKIKQLTVSEKTAMTAVAEDGTRQVALSGDRRLARVLGDDEIARLAAIGRQIELYYGAAQDIEWAVIAGQFAVLQARPIRGLQVAADVEAGRVAEIERLAALCGGRRRIWVAHNLGETLAAPTPLTWDIIRHFMSGAGGFGRFYHDLGYRPSLQVCEEGFLELIGQRIYADPERLAQLFWGKGPLHYDLEAVLADNALLDQAPMKFDPNKADGKFLLTLPGMLAAMLRSWRTCKRLQCTVREHFENEVLPPYLDYVRCKRGEDLGGLETPQVCAELRVRCVRVLDEFGKESLKPGFFGSLAFTDLHRLLGQLLGDAEGGRLASALSTGLEGDTTVAQNQLLYRVARGEAAMEEFLDAYGHRTAGEMELAEPRYREDPRQLDSSLQAMRRSNRSPEEIHQEHARRRAEIEKDLPALLARWGGSSFREPIAASIRQTQRLLGYREAGKHYLMLGYELIRGAILELARRWRLGQEVFFLRLAELEHFEARREELLAAAARRQVRWQSLQRLDMPAVIDSAELRQLGLPRPGVPGAPYAGAAELQGEAVAAGTAAGTARVVFDPREPRDLGEGYILVCPSTDPGWTPLFVSARGLVVERGGVLSHGAIVARDFGIPAVVCPGATNRIRDGRKLHLDGNRGTIHLLEET
jgi:pyruvate,water dikinase